MTSPSQHRPEGEGRDAEEKPQSPAVHSDAFLATARDLADTAIDMRVCCAEQPACQTEAWRIWLAIEIAKLFREVDRKAREDCAGIVTENYQGMAVAERLLLVNRATAILASIRS